MARHLAERGNMAPRPPWRVNEWLNEGVFSMNQRQDNFSIFWIVPSWSLSDGG